MSVADIRQKLANMRIQTKLEDGKLKIYINYDIPPRLIDTRQRYADDFCGVFVGEQGSEIRIKCEIRDNPNLKMLAEFGVTEVGLRDHAAHLYRNAFEGTKREASKTYRDLVTAAVALAVEKDPTIIGRIMRVGVEAAKKDGRNEMRQKFKALLEQEA